MLSSRLVDARPVRTVASLWRKSSITFSILLLVSLLTSLTMLSSEKSGVGVGLRIADCGFMSLFNRGLEIEIEGFINSQSAILLPTSDRLFGARSGLRPDDRAHALSCHRAFDVARLGHIEDEDRQIVVLTERDRGGVHHRKLFLQDSHIAKLVYLDRIRVFSGVGGVDSAYSGSLHNDVGLYLQRAHRRRGVSSEERLSDAGRAKDHAGPFVV